MSYCNKCKISLTGKLHQCPLCQGDLVGEEGVVENTFPVIPHIVQLHRRLLRVILFVTIVVAAICIAINLSLPTDVLWSVFVIGGLVSLWLSLAIAVKKRNNIPKNILWQVGVISILALAWDRSTGFYGWSIDFVIPILCTCAMVAMAVIAKIMRLHIAEYIIYLIIDSIFGIIPLLLIVFGCLNIVYPSAICVAASIISLAALLVFEGAALRAEIIRRMHL